MYACIFGVGGVGGATLGRFNLLILLQHPRSYTACLVLNYQNVKIKHI